MAIFQFLENSSSSKLQMEINSSKLSFVLENIFFHINVIYIHKFPKKVQIARKAARDAMKSMLQDKQQRYVEKLKG